MVSSVRSSKWLVAVVGLGVISVACSSSEATDSRGIEGERGGSKGTAGTSTGSTTAGPEVDGGIGTSTTGDTGASFESDGDAGGYGDPKGGDGDGDGDGAGGAGGASSSDVPAEVDPPEGKNPPTGQLTAGIFDDNLSFDFFQKYVAAVERRQSNGLLPFEQDDYVAAHDLFLQGQGGRTSLDLSLVIDTTGSMGDELGYLQTEFEDLSETIAGLYPNAEQRWSLVVYRDVQDDYLARAEDFTTDLDEFRSLLSDQTFDGGGDFPEAPEEGLKKANALSWSDDPDVARLLFWVADAPHHNERAQALAEEVVAAQSSDIHIYPVASSGVDELTEFTMRQSAQLTLGRYLFLTDDSGLGGSHAEPTLPCYYVSTLKDAILRGVQSEMSGERQEIASKEIVRFSGRINEEGNCYFGDGYEAVPF